MAAYKSSSLAASDLPRHSSGQVKNGLFRHSKQQLIEHKMFKKKMGSHGKDFQIGKKFNSAKHGMHHSGHIPAEDYGGHAEHKRGMIHKGDHEMDENKMEYHGGHITDQPGHGIGPSQEEFDDLMEASVTHDQNKKKSKFSRKFFG